MPVKIPDDLPAASILESENVFVMREGRANTTCPPRRSWSPRTSS